MLSRVRQWARERSPVWRSGYMTGAGPCAVGFPTIFHVTHWKAGSQWVNKILNRCVGDRVVFADHGGAQFLQRPLLAGRVYTTCYLTRDQFYSVPLPEPWYRFVVIRDLRDTLVSAYFSIRFSHVGTLEQVPGRERLSVSDLEGGLLYLLDLWLPGCADIQRSWLESGDKLIRYEELLKRDVKILVPLLTRQCPLGVPAQRVREAVLGCRFERLTQGRARGEEDIQSHERKGVVGDWRNHFTDRVTREFKARFGDLLVATGYEKNLHW